MLAILATSLSRDDASRPAARRARRPVRTIDPCRIVKAPYTPIGPGLQESGLDSSKTSRKPRRLLAWPGVNHRKRPCAGLLRAGVQHQVAALCPRIAEARPAVGADG